MTRLRDLDSNCPHEIRSHGHTATLLANGQVLVAGGYDSSSGIWQPLELYDVGLGFNAAWRPQIISVQLISGPGGSWPQALYD